MRTIELFLLALLMCCAMKATASENSSHYTGRLMEGRNGAVLVSDDGTYYQVPGIDRAFLNEHSGKRVMMSGPAAVFPAGSGANTPVIDPDEIIVYSDEIVVTAPRPRPVRETSDPAADAANATVLIAPMLPLPF